MKINTDIAFVTGATHKVCQDYARKGESFVLLSDGCSSSEDSDFGARILVKVFENTIRFMTYQEYEKYGTTGDGHWDAGNVLDIARITASNMKLPNECLDATLIWAQINGEIIDVKIFGDGCVFIKQKDGTIIIHEINFPTNYPFYINYLNDIERHKLIKETYCTANNFRKITTHRLSPDLKTVETTTAEELFTDKVREVNISVKDTSIVAVMSDGVGSFFNKQTNQPIPTLDVVKELCAFKNTAGEAVARRLNAFERDCAKKFWAHADDVSLGAIFVEEE